MKNNFFLRFLKEYAFSKKKIIQYIGIVFMISIYTICVTYAPKMQAKIVDMFSNNLNNYTIYTFINMFTQYIFLYVVGYIFDYLRKITTFKVSEEVAEDIRSKINLKLENITAYYFGENSFSDLASKVNKEVTVIKNSGVTMLITLITNMVTLVVVLLSMLKIHIFITLLIILLLIFYVVINRYVSKIIKTRCEENLDKNERMLNSLNDNFDNWKNNRFIINTNYSRDRFLLQNEKYKNSNVSLQKVYLLSNNLSIFVLIIGVMTIWLIGGKEIFKGVMTLGQLLLLTNYQNLLFGPVQYLSTFVSEYNASISALKRIFKFLDYDDEVEGKDQLINSINKIEFCNVSFSYCCSYKEILKQCNYVFERGHIYEIRGKSGSGKSTVIKLLSKLETPQRGNILLNGKNINKFTLKSFRKKMGIISSKSLFFIDTVFNNICLGKRYSISQIEEIGNKLDINEEIFELADRYNTLIQREHANLSEGQARRIDIVRMLLRNPDVIILDEATSALDRERRQMLYKYLEEIKNNKIIIIISHNEEENSNADIVYRVG